MCAQMSPEEVWGECLTKRTLSEEERVRGAGPREGAPGVAAGGPAGGEPHAMLDRGAMGGVLVHVPHVRKHVQTFIHLLTYKKKNTQLC